MLFLFLCFKAVPPCQGGFPGGSYGKETACNAGDPGSGISPGEGNSYSLVFLSGELHGQRSLVSYSSQCCKEPDTTERLILLLLSSQVHFAKGLEI